MCQTPLSSQMSEEELSSHDDRAYPDNREEVTMVRMWRLRKAGTARNRRMPNGTYGGVGGKETKVGQKTFVSRPTRLPQEEVRMVRNTAMYFGFRDLSLTAGPI